MVERARGFSVAVCIAAYLVNAYRVLLTRARQGMVIYVPLGSEIDDTRKPVFYDDAYAFLCECGIAELI